MPTETPALYIARLVVRGFKRFVELDVELHPRFCVIVGDNETGKSSLLEALNLVLTGQKESRLIRYAVDPYLFNADLVADYFTKLRSGGNQAPPEILIEAYLASPTLPPHIAQLAGTHNSRSEDCPGLSLRIAVVPEHVANLNEYARDDANPAVIPVEYYAASWKSFDGNDVTSRRVPFRTAIIDPLAPQGFRAPGRYISQSVGEVLSDIQRRELALEYKKLRYTFANEPGVIEVNEYLAKQRKGSSGKTLSLQMDMSARATWEQAISPHLDELPYACAGKGEQCRVQFRLAIAGAVKADILLIEEPENHLSHSNLNALLDDIGVECANRQVIITTHSAFVLNKLGLGNLVLVSSEGKPARLTSLDEETRNYFMKLPGFDTLRLILSARCILVEGPSDELIVQRAYLNKYGKLPLEDQVDVISVGALAFARFLQIAQLLRIDVRVLTDNDGDPRAVGERYHEYSSEDSSIRIFYDEDETCPSLEEQLLKANSKETINSILSKNYEDSSELLTYMKRNKTECALRFFESKEPWITPTYIQNAIAS